MPQYKGPLRAGGEPCICLGERGCGVSADLAGQSVAKSAAEQACTRMEAALA
jgi:hypothetical protein